jgi:hypothetical protein
MAEGKEHAVAVGQLILSSDEMYVFEPAPWLQWRKAHVRSPNAGMHTAARSTRAMG